MGMPLREGLTFVCDVLNGFDLKKEIKVIASGRILTGFNLIRAIAMGADLCNSARAMMMALGCIQALECNANTCPTGVATQNPSLSVGLNVKDKAVRVKNFQEETVHIAFELLAAIGLSELTQLNRSHINRRINNHCILRYDEIYPPIENGCLLQEETIPEEYVSLM